MVRAKPRKVRSARAALSAAASVVLAVLILIGAASILVLSTRTAPRVSSTSEGAQSPGLPASASLTASVSASTSASSTTLATTTTATISSLGEGSSTSISTSSTASYPGLISSLICSGCTVYEDPPYTFPTTVSGPCDVESAAKLGNSTLLPPSQWPYTDDKYVWSVGYSTGGVDQLLSATVAPNGSYQNETCLSCNNPSAPALDLFKIKPSLRPQGDWILLDVENPGSPTINQSSSIQLQVDRNNGYFANLWVTNTSGSRWYELTNFTAPAGTEAEGILSPTWSPNGDMVAFSETYKAPDQANLQGYWNEYVASFEVSNSGVPYLANVTSIDYPGDVFYETQTFSPDSTHVIVQSVTPGLNAYAPNLYSVDLVPGSQFGTYVEITNSVYSWNEHAVYSPDGQKIAWISSLPFPDIIPQYGTLPWSDYRDYLHNEFFLMNANGTGVQQLTWFNFPGQESTPQFGDAMFAEWNLAGTQLLIHNGTPEIQVPGGNSVWLLTFAGACG